MTIVYQTKNIRVKGGEIVEKAQIWAALENLTRDVVTHYRSDLYYDALTIRDLKPHEQIWYFCIGQCGTNILFSPPDTTHSTRRDALSLRKYGRPYIYECNLKWSRPDTLELTISDISEEK